MGNKPSSMLQDEEITLISEETGFSPAQIERLYSRFTALDKSKNGSLSCQDCLAIPELAINPLCDRIVHMIFSDCDENERINFRQFTKVLATFRSSHHKSSPTSRSGNVSRQESMNQQQQQSLIKQAPLLFDTIDLTSLSTLSRNHSRHSSFHDGYHHKEHTPLPLIDPDEPLNSQKQKLYFMFKIYDVNNDNLIDIEDLVAILKLMVGTYVDEGQVRLIAERTLREADKDCDGNIDFVEFCAAFSRKNIEDSLKNNFRLHLD